MDNYIKYLDIRETCNKIKTPADKDDKISVAIYNSQEYKDIFIVKHTYRDWGVDYDHTFTDYYLLSQFGIHAYTGDVSNLDTIIEVIKTGEGYQTETSKQWIKYIRDNLNNKLEQYDNDLKDYLLSVVENQSINYKNELQENLDNYLNELNLTSGTNVG